MVSVKIMLNRSRIRKDGTYPLVFQIIYLRQKKLIYTDYKLRTENFDPLKGKVVCDSVYLDSPKKVMQMNQRIKKQYKEICACIDELQRGENDFSVVDIVLRVRGEQLQSFSLLGFFDECIKLKQDLDKDGIAAAYKSTKSSLRTFLCDKDVNLSTVSVRFVDSYTYFLQKRKASDNTIKFYIRNFRSVYNAAIRRGCCFKESYPFAKFCATPSKTVKRALGSSKLRELYQLDLPKGSDMEKYRDLFLFSFFAQGMAFVDVVMLKKINICNGVITYYRHKSNQRVQVKITEQLQLLLEKYRNGSDYVFDIIDETLDRPVYAQYRVALAQSNRCLKKIGTMLGFEETLTTYVARHSWAMEAKNSGASLFVISEGMGHKSEKTTLIYLKDLDITVLDVVNRKVTSVVVAR